MSMKKDELCKLKIEIQTNNLFRYWEIATLVDKPKLLGEIKQVREKIQLSSLLPFRPNHWQIDSMKWASNNPKIEQELMRASKQLCRSFKRPKHMINDIYQAILFGKVFDSDPSVGIVHSKTYVERPCVAIFPTLSTTDKAIVKALKRAKRILKGDSILSLSFGFKANEPKKIAPHRVKQHREWYWRNLAGESYSDIALSLASKRFQADYKRRKAEHIEMTSRYELVKRPKVAQAIERYREALEKE